MLKEDNNPQSSLQTNRKSFDFKIDSLLSGYDSLFTLTQVLYGGKKHEYLSPLNTETSTFSSPSYLIRSIPPSDLKSEIEKCSLPFIIACCLLSFSPRRAEYRWDGNRAVPIFSPVWLLFPAHLFAAAGKLFLHTSCSTSFSFVSGSLLYHQASKTCYSQNRSSRGAFDLTIMFNWTNWCAIWKWVKSEVPTVGVAVGLIQY